MIKSALKQIGLTDGEIKVYLGLLEIGSSSIGKIIKKSGISGSKTYEVLDKLISKGLVGFIVKNNVKYFEASSPDRILNYLDEKSKVLEDEKVAIKKIIPDLILKQKYSYESDVKVFTGFEGFKTITEDIINSLKKGEEWLSMGLTDQPETWETYFNKKQKERAKKGIKHKHLINEKYKSLHKQRKGLSHTSFRFLSRELEMPISIEIYKEKVVIFVLTKENPLVIMMKNKEIFESFRRYFNYLWKISKA